MVAAASTALDTTTKVTQLETWFPLFFVIKERKKTKTCSFFLELMSVGSSLVKITIKQNKQTKKNQPAHLSHKRRSCATARSPAANRAGLAPFRTLTQFMQVIYWALFVRKSFNFLSTIISCPALIIFFLERRRNACEHLTHIFFSEVLSVIVDTTHNQCEMITHSQGQQFFKRH